MKIHHEHLQLPLMTALALCCAIRNAPAQVPDYSSVAQDAAFFRNHANNLRAEIQRGLGTPSGGRTAYNTGGGASYGQPQGGYGYKELQTSTSASNVYGNSSSSYVNQGQGIQTTNPYCAANSSNVYGNSSNVLTPIPTPTSSGAGQGVSYGQTQAGFGGYQQLPTPTPTSNVYGSSSNAYGSSSNVLTPIPTPGSTEGSSLSRWNYCGPDWTGGSSSLDPMCRNDWKPPVNSDDACCRDHDYNYIRNGLSADSAQSDPNKRQADSQLANCLGQDPNYERSMADSAYVTVAQGIFNGKNTLQDARDWWNGNSGGGMTQLGPAPQPAPTPTLDLPNNYANSFYTNNSVDEGEGMQGLGSHGRKSPQTEMSLFDRLRQGGMSYTAANAAIALRNLQAIR